MQLLGPAALSVEPAEKKHQQGCKGLVLIRRSSGASPRFRENSFGSAVIGGIRVTIGDTVIGKASSVTVEIIMALLERVEKVLQCRDASVRRLLQAGNPGVEGVRLAYE